jgi:hypothetical protein
MIVSDVWRVAGFRHARLRDRKMGVRRDPFQVAGENLARGWAAFGWLQRPACHGVRPEKHRLAERA